MSLIKIKTYEVKDSRNGYKVPVVNGVHIHSIYYPQKEGEYLFEKYIDLIKKNSNLLILGLGYGYHLQKIIEYLNTDNTSFQISVVEPNEDVIKDCIEMNQVELKNIKIYCSPVIDKLFCSEDFIDFLLKKPVVIAHQTSFDLYKEYFTKFLSYKSPKNLDSSIKNLGNEEARDYFINQLKKTGLQYLKDNQISSTYHNKDLSIDSCLEEVAEKKLFERRFEFVLSALNNICKSKNRKMDKNNYE